MELPKEGGGETERQRGFRAISYLDTDDEGWELHAWVSIVAVERGYPPVGEYRHLVAHEPRRLAHSR